MEKRIAIRFFGTQTALAEQLQISRQAVSKWPARIPEQHAMRLHFMTSGELEYKASDYDRSTSDGKEQTHEEQE